jgi:YHS domain-containing protein
MTSPFRTLSALTCLLLLGFSAPARSAGEPAIAIQGYDAVAYFTIATPTRGSPEFSHVWDGERYLFAKAEHRDRFAKDPERYAPQFPSHCAAALTQGQVVTPDPRNWIIIEGKLYLFGNANGQKRFRENPQLVQAAQANWKRTQKTAN